MKNIYKTILHTILEPLLTQDEEQLSKLITRLKQSDGEQWAVGEMLERALKYIEITKAVVKEMEQDRLAWETELRHRNEASRAGDEKGV